MINKIENYSLMMPLLDETTNVPATSGESGEIPPSMVTDKTANVPATSGESGKIPPSMVTDKTANVPATSGESGEIPPSMVVIEKLEDYQVSTENFKDVFSGEDVTNFLDTAVKLKLSKEQVDGLLAMQKQTIQGEMDKFNKTLSAEESETVKNLRAEYGSDYDAVLHTANKVMNTLGLADLVKNNGLGSNLVMIKALNRIGGLISENKLDNSFQPTNAKSELDRILNDDKSPYYDENHPRNREYVDRVKTLMML